MEADGLEEIESGISEIAEADAGDYYVAGASFGSATLPNSNAYNGTDSGVSVTNFSTAGSSMTATFTVSQTHTPEINLKQGDTNISDGGSYDFDSTSAETVFTIENIGTADLMLLRPLTIGGADADQFFIQDNPAPLVGAGTATSFTVGFSPTSAGIKTATISIVNNDSNENPYELTIVTVTHTPEINLRLYDSGDTNISEGGSYDFGSRSAGSGTYTFFAIENTGTADLTLTTPLTIAGADADQFFIEVNPAWFVGAGGTTSLKIRFMPTSAGAKTATISIANNDSDENPYDLTVTGVSILKGDLNGDSVTDLTDAIIALQAITGFNPALLRTDYVVSGTDVNGDNQVGTEELIYILQDEADLR